MKLFSFHLILMGLVLLAPEMRRLFAVLVLNRGTHASTLAPLARGDYLVELSSAVEGGRKLVALRIE